MANYPTFKNKPEILFPERLIGLGYSDESKKTSRDAIAFINTGVYKINVHCRNHEKKNRAKKELRFVVKMIEGKKRHKIATFEDVGDLIKFLKNEGFRKQ